MRASAPLLLLLCAALGFAQEVEPRPGGVVAIVDGTPITRYELDLACRLLPDFTELTPGSTLWRKAISEQLEFLIEQRLVVARAREDKVELTASDEAFLQSELERRAQTVGGMNTFRAQIQEQLGVPYDYFVARQKAALLRQKMLTKGVSQDIFIAPSEVRSYYRRNLTKWQRKGETRLRQIVIYHDLAEALRKPPGLEKWLAQQPWSAEDYAKAIKARLDAGEHFADVAADTSLGPKWREEIVIPSSQSLDLSFIRPLGERIEALRPGQISEPIPTVRPEIYLIELVDRRPAGPLPLSDVQSEIERTLKLEIRAQREAVWLKELREGATVRIYLEGVAK